jgi:hypothetical protein
MDNQYFSLIAFFLNILLYGIDFQTLYHVRRNLKNDEYKREITSENNYALKIRFIIFCIDFSYCMYFVFDTNEQRLLVINYGLYSSLDALLFMMRYYVFYMLRTNAVLVHTVQNSPLTVCI